MSIYTNEQKIEAVLQRELTNEEKVVVSDVIEAVGKAINSYTGRRWLDLDKETADEEVRHFDGNGKRELFINDFISISRIRFKDSLGTVTSTLPAKSYICYPANSSWRNSVFLRDRSFPRVRSGVEIKGLFYTGVVPVDIQLASSTLVGHFFASSRNVGDFKKESIEGYSYEILTGDEKTSQDKATLNKIDYWRKVNL
jgi:hypothetical protein